MHPSRVLVFDVNETLLDLSALAPMFQRAFGHERVLDEWFTTLLLYSQVTTIAGPYNTFGTIARAALEMTASSHGVTLSAGDADGILSGLTALPAHPDVVPALDALKSRGFRLVTLTNSAPDAVGRQMTSAGIGHYFERSLSVDRVKRFKPAPEVYRLVGDELGLPASRLRLIAAHAWDVHGALQAGWAAAFVARPGKVLFPLGPRPDIARPTLGDVAADIIRVDAGS
jgi:2-haloacid dehalogenase